MAAHRVERGVCDRPTHAGASSRREPACGLLASCGFRAHPLHSRENLCVLPRRVRATAVPLHRRHGGGDENGNAVCTKVSTCASFVLQPLCCCLQPLSLPARSPRTLPHHRDSCGPPDAQIERDFKMSCMSLQIGQTKPVTQALIPAASFSQVLVCSQSHSHWPTRDHDYSSVASLAATLPRLQVPAPRALPGARFGRHPEAGVSPFRAWPPALHSFFRFQRSTCWRCP